MSEKLIQDMKLVLILQYKFWSLSYLYHRKLICVLIFYSQKGDFHQLHEYNLNRVWNSLNPAWLNLIQMFFSKNSGGWLVFAITFTITIVVVIIDVGITVTAILTKNVENVHCSFANLVVVPVKQFTYKFIIATSGGFAPTWFSHSRGRTKWLVCWSGRCIKEVEGCINEQWRRAIGCHFC